MKKSAKENKNPGNLSRRNFLGTVGAATAAFTIIPSHVMAGRGYQQPSDMVNVAGIGVGAQGGGDIQQVCSPDEAVIRPQRTSTGQPYTKEQLATLEKERASMAGGGGAGGPGGGGRPGEGFPNFLAGSTLMAGQRSERVNLANIYALCDVDSNYAGHVFKGYPKAKIYSDWRVMLEKEPSIDAVVIGTPDHNHAPIAAAFIKAKKHVYVEKPMAKTVFEARRLAELAKQYDVVTQMGNQGHATEGSRQTVEWIQAGVIGNVREVHMSTDRPTWPQGNLTRPAGMRVPKTLNWDVWLGPAPEKPYHPDITHFNWRGLWDYGTGAMGDGGAHEFDTSVWALNLDKADRIKIQATATPFNDEYLPQSELVTYEFPERFTPGVGYMPPVTVTWYDGGLEPPRPAVLENGRSLTYCTLFIGDKGIMVEGSHGSLPQVIPYDPDFKGPDPWIPRTGNIFEDWIGAIRSGKKSSNDFSYAAKLTEIMLLANIALKTINSDTILEYDVPNMQITNLPVANDYLHYEYRQGWTL
ncbi:MAG: Gfo/Idh/MocA family oxidoreductase [Bacteroidales bacterium]|nr:Gfo/Idh/MocA family oxidoreductase [Bacteroidales bacterium]